MHVILVCTLSRDQKDSLEVTAFLTKVSCADRRDHVDNFKDLTALNASNSKSQLSSSVGARSMRGNCAGGISRPARTWNGMLTYFGVIAEE